MRTHTLRHSRQAKLLTALAVLALAGAVSGLAVAASSAVSIPRVGADVVVPTDKAAAMANRMPSAATDIASVGPAAVAAFTPNPIPAAILGSDVPVPVPASVINETNGWLDSNGSNLVAVYAGSNADDPTQGRVVILRRDLRTGTQTVQIVDAGSTGALTVAASAPTGASVETSALTGPLVLGTSHGGTVRLNLETSAVSTR